MATNGDATMNLHLTVINPDDSINLDRANINWNRHDVRWTDIPGGKGVAWRAVRLRWWDDASYAAYQGDRPDGEE